MAAEVPAAQVQLTRPLSASAAPGQPATTAYAVYSTSRQAGSDFQWIGWLQRSGRVIGDRPTYRLEMQNGMLYANGANGVNLEPYVGHYVELIGTANYYGAIRTNYMSVSQVRQIQ
jgi:hypothetical protein